MRSVCSAAALVFLLTSTACGTLSNEDIAFLSALPRKNDLHVQVPVQSTSAQPACAIGDAADWRKAKDTGDQINSAVDGVLALVDVVRTVPPAQRKTDLRVWGPFPDQQHPGVEYQVSILRFPPPPDAKESLAYLYSFEGRRSGRAFETVIDGFFLGGQAKGGQGEVDLHFDAAYALGTNKPDDPHGDMVIRYDETSDPRTVQLDLGQGGLALDPFDYFYAGYSNGSGRFDYVLNDASRGTHEVISAFFKANGSGTADITFRTPLATASVNECWDELACLTFVRDPLSVTNLCGVNASCGVPSACPVVP
jgi:hypothetical protein